MTSDEKVQQQIAQLQKRLWETEQALFHLMVFVGLIDNSPVTPEEEAWARQIVAEGRHRQPSKPLTRREP